MFSCQAAKRRVYVDRQNFTLNPTSCAVSWTSRLKARSTIRATVEEAPDAPLTKVLLNMQRRQKGRLEAGDARSVWGERKSKPHR